MVIETRNVKETLELGIKIGQEAKPGLVIALEGDLGVGKTVLAQGVAKGLGVEEMVCSPTFTIVQVYEEGRYPFYHFDVYRLEDPDEMYEVGFEDYFYGEGVCMVEWAEMIKEILPSSYLKIEISKDPQQGVDYRKITLTQVG
ncbi:MAG TPA: tRNA (adenosine(37)-N6)-threonylcarbamoyltransferase complex ATPase subunit type 1 TsaE [Lachnospiraceae bacterium]|nr:tRNA (adenosine(37)-N6)-threonylcarbamoyltransferase complex ATPase subunit type 1 TsaE [Lachnospiraceae bacterium]HPF29538.1 tRNA (adenosine(37)-N6)-threonylcarbamoyltransferase complex ATPase subunit type 1 TsaE [Lachnospiraceae bacterium]